MKLADFLKDGVWHIKFVRNFNKEEEVLWRDLKEALI